MSLHSTKWLILLIIISSLIIRLYKINNLDIGSAWDEGYYANVARYVADQPEAEYNLGGHQDVLNYTLKKEYLGDKGSNLLHPPLFTVCKDLINSKYKCGDKLLINKPPLLFWLGGLSYYLFGNYPLSLRAISILFSILAILFLYKLVLFQFDKNTALLASFFFAFDPIFLSFGRIFMTDALVICFSLGSSYFLLSGVLEKKIWKIIFGGLFVALNWYTKLYAGLFTHIGLFIYLLFEIKKDRGIIKYFGYSCISFICGSLLFLLWPIILSTQQDKFAGIWAIDTKEPLSILSFYYNVRSEGTSLLEYINNIISFRYAANSPNFSFSYTYFYWSLPFLFIALHFALKLSKRLLADNSSCDVLGHWLFWGGWAIGFLPYHASHSHQLYYLILIIPPIAALFGFFGSRILTFFTNKLIPVILIPIIIIPSLIMIEKNDEVLERTYYKESANYLNSIAKFADNRFSIIANFFPGMTYYMRRPVEFFEYLNKKKIGIADFIQDEKVRFVIAREIDENKVYRSDIKQNDYESIMKKCKEISQEAGIPAKSNYKLFDCAKILYSQKDYIIDGKFLTPSFEIKDGGILVENGLITKIFERRELDNFVSSFSIKIIKTEGIIYPGFINLNNHLAWNYFEPFKLREKFTTRYQFFKSKEYLGTRKKYDYLKKNKGCEVSLFPEIREIIGGTTSIQSSYDYDCKPLLARNLNNWDETRGLKLVKAPIINKSFLKERVKNDIKKNRAILVINVGEGNDALNNELYKLDNMGLLRQNTIILHGISFGEKEFSLIKERGANLVWSPKSDLTLYGKTMDVVQAHKVGINIALGTDWNLTGSENIYSEFLFARKYNKEKLNGFFTDKELYNMITINPAAILNHKNNMGKLVEGAFADIISFSVKNDDPIESLINSSYNDLIFNIVNGKLQYGEPKIFDEMKTKYFGVKICSHEKGLAVDYERIMNELKRVLNELPNLIANCD